MPSSLQNFTVLAGRILLGLLFVLSGFGKIAGFEGTVGYIACAAPADCRPSSRC